jgi:hypothetical protein
MVDLTGRAGPAERATRASVAVPLITFIRHAPISINVILDDPDTLSANRFQMCGFMAIGDPGDQRPLAFEPPAEQVLRR